MGSRDMSSLVPFNSTSMGFFFSDSGEVINVILNLKKTREFGGYIEKVPVSL